MTKLKDWIDKIHQVDRGLAALLRGLVFIRRDNAARSLVFVWHAAFHKTAGGEREADIRAYLAPMHSTPSGTSRWRSGPGKILC